MRICVPFPNAPIASIIQSPRCPLNASKAAAPAASNDALEAATHQKHKHAAAALLLHQHSHHSKPRETGMLSKLIAQPHVHRHLRSQSPTRKMNIMVPYRPTLPRYGPTSDRFHVSESHAPIRYAQRHRFDQIIHIHFLRCVLCRLRIVSLIIE